MIVETQTLQPYALKTDGIRPSHIPFHTLF